MAFSLSGSTITQTGTDTNLSALAGVTGVTVQTVGSGNSQFNRYFIESFKLFVSGTLTIDPRNESLHLGASSPDGNVVITSTGVLNLGTTYTQSGQTFITKGLAIECANPSLTPDADNSNGSLGMYSGGVLNIVGATLKVAAVLNLRGGSTVNIQDGEIINTRGSLIRARQRSNLTINGLVLKGGVSFDFFVLPTSFSRYAPEQGDRGLEYVSAGATGSDDVYENVGYSSKGLNYDLSSWGGSDVKFVNPEGTPVGVSGPNSATNNLIRQYGQTEITFLTQSGTSIEGVKTYFKDHDNNNRNNTIPRSGANYALNEFKTYSSTSDASGKGSLEILVRAAYPGTNLNTQSGYSYREMVSDWRTENSDGIVRLLYASYGHSLSTSDVDLIIGDVNTFNWTLVDDRLITQSDKSIVSNYTTIDTSAQLYDRAKVWLVDNFTGQTKTLVSRLGNEIDAENYNIVIDKTAASAFTFANDTITIKADVFTGNIKTAGGVTLQNGAEIVGGILDADGDSFLSFEGLESWGVYQTQADANQEARPAGTGSASDNFRFIFTANKTYYIRLVESGETIFKTITPTAKGETKVTLATASQIAALGGRLSALQADMAKEATLDTVKASALTASDLAPLAKEASVTDIKSAALTRNDLTPLAKETTAASAKDHARAANAQTKPKITNE